jgi:hypothetical protein
MEGLKVVGVHNGRTKLVTLSPQSSDGKGLHLGEGREGTGTGDNFCLH